MFVRYALSIVFTGIISLSITSPLSAHFVWLFKDVDDRGNVTLRMSFAEGAIPEGASIVDPAKLNQVVVCDANGNQNRIALHLDADAECFAASIAEPIAIHSLTYEYGLFSRGDSSSKLSYYAMTGPAPDSQIWNTAQIPSEQLLYIRPTETENDLQFEVNWMGKPIDDAQVIIEGPQAGIEAHTNEQGIVSIDSQGIGLYEIRARVAVPTPGQIDGAEYSQELHYATLVFSIDGSESRSLATLTRLPNPTTSFGAAILNDTLFVYGGHHGEAHHYSASEQGSELLALDIQQDATWKSIVEGEGMQGLALLAHEDSLYRIGGLQAKNATGQDHDLWSSNSFARFRLDTNEWESLTPLPERRSSFDATILNDKLYIVGGWTLSGEDESNWLDTAYCYDLTMDEPEWVAIAQPPFERRAIALAPFDGKLYVIGGMTHDRGPTTAVSVYDPSIDQWHEGPSLPGEGMDGFGTSATVASGYLFATTMEGNLHRLGPNSQVWERVGELSGPRFFHRMVSVDDRYLLLIGGADMSIGKFDDLEWFDTQTTQNSSASDE